jgi:hypothetical protein
MVRFLGHKKHEDCRGMNTSSEPNMVSFPTPTHTHVFGIRINCYDHLNAADVHSLVDR